MIRRLAQVSHKPGVAQARCRTRDVDADRSFDPAPASLGQPPSLLLLARPIALARASRASIGAVLTRRGAGFAD
jgi:hypothetical protein